MASNPYVNKVEFGNRTVMDISDTTAEESDVAEGEVFYKGNGQRSVGTGNYYSPNDTAETAIADNDYFPFYDTSATGKRKTLWSNIKAKLKAYFDEIYSTFSGSYTDLTDKPTIYKKGVYYGTCTGQAANQTKAVTIAAAQGFTLEAGATIYVKFNANNTYSATADAPVKLNVNNTGAKNIYFGGSSTPTGTNTTAFGRTNYINQYIYDGTYWVWQGSSADNNTTYSAMSVSELTTGTATTARSVRADYLKTGVNSLIDTKLTNYATPIELTKAEYDALPTSEKEDPTKVYYVTDYDPFPTDIIDDTTTALDKVWSSSKTLSEITDCAKVVYSAQVTTETVWSNVQRALLVAPTAPTGYKFLAWIGLETMGSVNAGYVSNPVTSSTYAYYPNLTTNITVRATALFIRNYT